MIPLCRDQGVGVIPYSPLARGLLSGSRGRAGHPLTARAGSDPLAGNLYGEADFDVVDAVVTVAAERGLAPTRVALAWLLGNPDVTAPIVGATRPTHLQDAVAAVDLTLTDEERKRLEAPYHPHWPTVD